MIDFKNSLNEEQFKAVTAPDGPILIIAAAGTGKTRTLVYRVAYLVEKGVNPSGILLLTFTNKAAREMLERAQELAGQGVAGIWGGTFHHMANRLLRRHGELIGFGHDFTILDSDDSRKIVSDSIKERKIQASAFPKPRVLLSLFSAAANTEKDVREILSDRVGDLTVSTESIMQIYEDYEQKKKELRAMDFDDLLVNCLKLLKENEQILRRYQEQFSHVLVDEYQDTNTLQAQIVDMMAALNRNILVVGDDFQSIYSWRGADFLNIMSFPDRYVDAGKYILETNYRSVPEILEVANACIAGNPHQFQKNLRATREQYKKPQVVLTRDGTQQARFVVGQIERLRRSGYKYSEIAVLYRAHFHAMELQMELSRGSVPYNITSGARFFEQIHIKDVCSILKVLENHGDEMAFSRLVELLPGVGRKTSLKIWRKLGGSFDPARSSHLEIVRTLLRADAMPGWDAFEKIFAAYDEDMLHEDGGEVIFRLTRDFYETYARNSFENAERRLDDINELVTYTANFDTVEHFLSEVALLTNLDAEIENFNDGENDAVCLSTVHQAKGLEWPAVILVWLVDGMFPSSRSLSDSLDGESEERRLFYVAVTRAKDELCMCVPECRRTRDGKINYCSPSRFVKEIPHEMLEEVSPHYM